MSRQNCMPLYEALLRYKRQRIVPFDVPGHKQGRGNPELRDFLGAECLSVDVNSMKPLDNLGHPTSVIKEAEQLAAEAFGCQSAFFMVGGTTSSVQAMLMSCLKEGDKVIMPRNVHRSAINALVITGAVPVYVNPGIHSRLGISLGMPLSEVAEAIESHPDAKAVFINNPTYYGICSDIKAIIELAHSKNILVLADEAHGTHFYFGEGLPPAAIHAGADMAAVSIHKTGGSLTQSSMLLLNSNVVSSDYVRTIINLTQTTSASYLLLASLDIARKNLAVNGKKIFENVMEIAAYARREVNKIGDFYAYGKEIVNNIDTFGFDETKLCINTTETGLAGIEIYDILRDEYGIQTELGDLGTVLAIISVGDTNYAIERLVSSLVEIRRRYKKDSSGLFTHEYINPSVIVPPKQAFYLDKIKLPVKQSAGHISGEFVMCYPPGIPVLAPGEAITDEVIRYIAYAKEKGCLMTGAEDMELEYINVLKLPESTD